MNPNEKSKVVVCCFNCSHYHFYSGKCDLTDALPEMMSTECNKFRYFKFEEGNNENENRS